MVFNGKVSHVTNLSNHSIKSEVYVQTPHAETASVLTKIKVGRHSIKDKVLIAIIADHFFLGRYIKHNYDLNWAFKAD